MEDVSCPGCRELVARLAKMEAVGEQQRQKIERQETTIAGLRQQLQVLQEKIDELQRQNKRQAAPFSKGPPKPAPKPPGRKPGDAYGMKACRTPPRPGQISERYQAPLPEQCPHCGSRRLEERATTTQYQVELPRQPIYREFTIQRGRCLDCRRPVQGRHELQTSDAVGAAGSQLGSRLQAFLAILQKQLGLSHGKCVQLLQRTWGISLTRGGVVQALQRLAKRVAPAVERIRQAIRASPEVAVDETGWRIGGRSAWLHTQATKRAVNYAIDRSRSSAVTARVLGWDYAGVLDHDGLPTYDQFRAAQHQQCLGHVLRRCHDLLTWVKGRSAAVLEWIKGHLQKALAYRVWLQKQPQRQVTVGLWVWLQREELLRRLNRWRPRRRKLARLRRFLRYYSASLFTFLLHGSEATTWRAEQALRPAVVNRKVWGGSRTQAGAAVQSSLMTILATLECQARPVLEVLSRTLCQGSLRLRFAS